MSTLVYFHTSLKETFFLFKKVLLIGFTYFSLLFLFYVLSEAHNEINGLDFCLDGGTYATAGKDLNVRLYCAETNKVTLSIYCTNAKLKVFLAHGGLSCSIIYCL